MNLDLTMGFAIIGTVELVKRLFSKDYQSATIIVGAAIVGALVGPQVGLTWLAGAIMGLQGSGIITTASYISGVKTPVVPTPAV